ncbi:hypothetical protein S40293_11582 [Stachybotrys chartarum IBT 40293]|nr:hypothetical protein S40293_11582 [Stachybotrys chartarum IBT 40293]
MGRPNMGHRLGDSSTYVRYYMTDFVNADTQAIVFGSNPETDFNKLISRLSRHGKAPTKLSDQERDEVFNDPTLVRYWNKRSKALASLKKKGFKSVAAAKRAGVSKRYEKYHRGVDNLRKKLEAKRLERAIVEFHKNIYGEEIAQQLKGIRPCQDVLAPQTVEYELEERAEVAELFSQPADIIDREELFKLQMRLVLGLARLCKRRESPCRPKAPRKPAKPRSRGTQPQNSNKACDSCYLSPGMQQEPPSRRKTPEIPGSLGASRIFPFCRWQDAEVGEKQRKREWRMDSLARHVRTQHLLRIEMPFNCPYGECGAVLGTDEHFASHAARAHGDHYPASLISK